MQSFSHQMDSEEVELNIALSLSLEQSGFYGIDTFPVSSPDIYKLSSNENNDADMNLAISLSIKDNQQNKVDIENYDVAIARSISDAEEMSVKVEETDYAIALSLHDKNGIWFCSFCSFYSPADYNNCIMCNSKRSKIEVDETKEKKCGLPGCQLPSSIFDFCSDNHRERAKVKRILPPAEKGIQTVFMGPSGDYTVHLLNKDHSDHLPVKTQFLLTWLKLEYGNPHIMRIYKIRNHPTIYHNFELKKLELGNVQSRFHGTSQHSDCNFGSNPSIPPCHRESCRVCNICKESFQLLYSGQNAGKRMKLRYGNGLYFSATSSKSHDYNEHSEKILRQGDHKKQSWSWRSTFLCSVVLGRPHVTTAGELPSHMCPPSGCDSVEGIPGVDLNYDEVVVYSNQQALPTHLIVYTLPPL